MEFVNTGIIPIFTSFVYFDDITDALLNWTGISKTTYSSFTPDWYMTAGKSICIFIFLSAFISNSKEMYNFTKISLKRLSDRRFAKHLK